MPRIKRQPARRMQTVWSSMVDIEKEIDRWNGVKTAHDFLNDMQVARMLLDCYDLIGGNALTWTNKDPPQSDEALQLKQKAEEGWKTLQEIRTLMVLPEVKEPPARKSKRKQAKVQHFQLEMKEVKEESEEASPVVPESNADEEYQPEGEAEDDDDDDDDPSSDWERGNKKTQPAPKPYTGKKRGRPRKGEVRPKKEPKRKKPPAKKPKVTKPKVTKPKVTKPKVSKETKVEGEQPKNRGRAVSRIVYECKECLKQFDSEKSADEFRAHYRTHLPPELSGEPQMEIRLGEVANIFWLCLTCGLVVKNLYSHRAMKHHPSYRKPRMCDTCGKILTTESSWQNHKNIHIAEKSGTRHVCELCGKTFVMLSFLRDHMKRHTSKRPFICDLCGKGFKSNPHLNRHKLTHENVKPLTCEHCGKGFSCQYNLKGHMRTHTGEKPFKCDICPAAFTHNVSLKSHKKSAHGIDLWSSQQSQVLETFDEETLQGSLRKVTPSLQGKYFENEQSDIKQEEAKETLQKEVEKCVDQLQQEAGAEEQPEKTPVETMLETGDNVERHEQPQTSKEIELGCPVAMAMAATNIVVSQQHQAPSSNQYQRNVNRIQQQHFPHREHQQHPPPLLERPHLGQPSHPPGMQPPPPPLQAMGPSHGMPPAMPPARVPVSSSNLFDLVNIPFQRPHHMFNFNQ